MQTYSDLMVIKAYISNNYWVGLSPLDCFPIMESIE
jgi:hypothetical protein